jgi:hypothetical protein
MGRTMALRVGAAMTDTRTISTMRDHLCPQMRAWTETNIGFFLLRETPRVFLTCARKGLWSWHGNCIAKREPSRPQPAT